MVRTAAERLMNSPTCSLGHPCAKRIKVARMNIGTTFTWLTIWLAAGLRMVPCQAQTAWPAAMPELTRGWSESSLTAVLPEPVQITQPAPGLAASQRSFSGLWAGWACQSASCDVKVAIERVDDQGATVAFAGANGWQSPVQDRGQGQFVGAELHTPLKTGAKLVLRLRADGDMDMSLWRAERLLSVGVLSQQAPGYTRQVVRVPTPWVENDQPVTLEMVVYRPGHASGFTTMASGTPPASPVKPMPTLVFNHGSTGDGDKPAWFKHTWVSPEVGKYFVGKGWQVVFPQRRGRGASGGLYDEGFEPDRSRYACLAEFSLPGLERAVADLDAVMAHLRQQPEVDMQRLLVGGVSRGGVLSVVYAGERPELFLGVLNFVGGWVGDRCRDAVNVNPASFSRGATMQKPMLWLYGEGDPLYAISHSRGNFEAFTAAGGQGEFLTFKVPGGDSGHSVHRHPALWKPVVESYLEKQGLQGLR